MGRALCIPRVVSGVALIACCLTVPGCPPERSAIGKAIDYLALNQTAAPLDVRIGPLRVIDRPGNWPQFFYFDQVPEIQFPDVSPFTVAFIHHSLALVHEGTAPDLPVFPSDVDAARNMRVRAMGFLHEFAARPGDADAGTFGFWPYEQNLGTEQPLLEAIFRELLAGPVFGGERTPINVGYYPTDFAIPSDADVTATTYAAILDDMLIDGGPGTNETVPVFFSDWRDLGAVNRRLNPAWLPNASGAFLTWLTYKDPPDPSLPNDVDLIVNANVLHTLGRYNALGTPGVVEAVALINDIVDQGLHEIALPTVTSYYPDSFVFHYCVSRAYHEGPVPGLQPAVNQLTDELAASARIRSDGAVYWDRSSPHLNTAYALLTLLNAGRDGPLVDGAAAYLVAEQDPVLGCWDSGVFFVGRPDGGQEIRWESASFTTAIALEALCRYELAESP